MREHSALRLQSVLALCCLPVSVVCCVPTMPMDTLFVERPRSSGGRSSPFFDAAAMARGEKSGEEEQEVFASSTVHRHSREAREVGLNAAAVSLQFLGAGRLPLVFEAEQSRAEQRQRGSQQREGTGNEREGEGECMLQSRMLRPDCLRAGCRKHAFPPEGRQSDGDCKTPARLHALANTDRRTTGGQHTR
jgi:hypothetical protein